MSSAHVLSDGPGAERWRAGLAAIGTTDPLLPVKSAKRNLLQMWGRLLSAGLDPGLQTACPLTILLQRRGFPEGK